MQTKRYNRNVYVSSVAMAVWAVATEAATGTATSEELMAVAAVLAAVVVVAAAVVYPDQR